MLVKGSPSRRSGLASLRRGNQRLRSRERRPNKSEPRVRHREPTRRGDNSSTNAAKPVRRSIDAWGWALDASHRPNHWALGTSPDPATRPGPLSGQLEQAPLQISIRERAFRSPTGLLCRSHNGPGVISLPADMISPPSGCLMRPGPPFSDLARADGAIRPAAFDCEAIAAVAERSHPIQRHPKAAIGVAATGARSKSRLAAGPRLSP